MLRSLRDGEFAPFGDLVGIPRTRRCGANALFVPCGDSPPARVLALLLDNFSAEHRSMNDAGRVSRRGTAAKTPLSGEVFAENPSIKALEGSPL